MSTALDRRERRLTRLQERRVRAACQKELAEHGDEDGVRCQPYIDSYGRWCAIVITRHTTNAHGGDVSVHIDWVKGRAIAHPIS